MDAAYENLLKRLGADLLPIIADAAKAAIATASPVAAVIADPVLDEIDAYVVQMLNPGTAAPAVTAPTDVASQIMSLQKHVAALTVATGHGSSAAMVQNKASPVAVPAPAAQ